MFFLSFCVNKCTSFAMEKTDIKYTRLKLFIIFARFVCQPGKMYLTFLEMG